MEQGKRDSNRREKTAQPCMFWGFSHKNIPDFVPKNTKQECPIYAVCGMAYKKMQDEMQDES